MVSGKVTVPGFWFQKVYWKRKLFCFCKSYSRTHNPQTSPQSHKTLNWPQCTLQACFEASCLPQKRHTSSAFNSKLLISALSLCHDTAAWTSIDRRLVWHAPEGSQDSLIWWKARRCVCVDRLDLTHFARLNSFLPDSDWSLQSTVTDRKPADWLWLGISYHWLIFTD